VSSPFRPVIETLFKIVNRSGETVPFVLNDQQAQLDADWSRRNLITKLRQHGGISSYVIARYAAKCISMENRNCVLVSHEAEATSRLLNRARFMVTHMPPDIRPPKLDRDSTRAMYFSETNSYFYIGTAGQKTFGHGDTITDLHLSEAARYSHPEQIRDGTFPAAEQGEITIESTGDGMGNWFHQQAMLAREGMGFKLFFFPWVGVPSCTLALTDIAAEYVLNNLSEELEEKVLYSLGISLGQLAWRRERIAEFGGDLTKFKEAFPRTFEECFRPAGLSFFPKVNYKETKAWRQEAKGLHVLEGHPRERGRYVFGADVSAGTGNDNSTIIGFDLDLGEQVLAFAANDLAPHEFGLQVNELGRRFNHAYVNVERNTFGLMALERLVATYPLDRLHRGSSAAQSSQQIMVHPLHNYGTLVSESTRGLLISHARMMLVDWTIHDPLLYTELSNFVENKTGKYEAGPGTKDDRVFGCCHALVCVERAEIATYIPVPKSFRTTVDPFSWEGLFKGHDGPSVNEYGFSTRFG
jgi:hypothetical protein